MRFKAEIREKQQKQIQNVAYNILVKYTEVDGLHKYWILCGDKTVWSERITTRMLRCTNNF